MRTDAGTSSTQPTELWGHYEAAPPAGGHVRVHPLLGWTELDIWRYARRESIPVCELYFAREGKRFRSLGERDITFPIDSDARSIDAIIGELEATKSDDRALANLKARSGQCAGR